MIYLYLKTHNQTGLKYLGKTTRDPFKYQGSGTIWKRHIKKYGNDVTTEVLFETKCKDDFREFAQLISSELNIVESTEFANMTNEEGQGGTTIKDRKAITNGISVKYIDGDVPDGWEYGLPEFSNERRNNHAKARIGKKTPAETKSKISKNRKGKGTGPSDIRKKAMNRPEVKQKLSEIGKTKTGKDNSFYGRTHSEEAKAKIAAKKKGSIPSNRKPVNINGVEYCSIAQASEETGLSKYLIHKILKL